MPKTVTYSLLYLQYITQTMLIVRIKLDVDWIAWLFILGIKNKHDYMSKIVGQGKDGVLKDNRNNF